MLERGPELLTDLVVDLETALKRVELAGRLPRDIDKEKVSAVITKLANHGVRTLDDLKNLGFKPEEIELCSKALVRKTNDTIN